MLCGIAGPLATGKSTLVNLLAPQLPIDSIIVSDLHDTVYDRLLEGGNFRDFREVTKDRDYFLIYVNRVLNHYMEMVDAYREYPGLVLFDGTGYDLLIYSMLNLWYHYPCRGLQEDLMHKLLEYRNVFDIIYMTKSDDINFPIKKTRRQYNTGFLKNRTTELYYYDIFRELPHIVTLPSSSVMDCDRFILDDLKERGLL